MLQSRFAFTFMKNLTIYSNMYQNDNKSLIPLHPPTHIHTHTHTHTHTHPSVALSLYAPVEKLSESYFTIGLLLRSIVHLLITDMTLIYGSSLVKLKRRNECKMKQKFSF